MEGVFRVVRPSSDRAPDRSWRGPHLRAKCFSKPLCDLSLTRRFGSGNSQTWTGVCRYAHRCPPVELVASSNRFEIDGLTNPLTRWWAHGSLSPPRSRRLLWAAWASHCLQFVEPNVVAGVCKTRLGKAGDQALAKRVESKTRS